MARVSIDPAAAIPDADLREQQVAVTTEPLTSADGTSGPVGELADADPGDLLEQVAVVPDGDDDYPNARDPWHGRDA